MSNVLVVLETAGGKLRAHSLPGITAGQQIAQAHGGELHLLVLGADPVAAQAIAAAGYGAKAVHTVANPALEPFTAEAWATRSCTRSRPSASASWAARPARPCATVCRARPLCSTPRCLGDRRGQGGRHVHAPDLGRSCPLDEKASGSVVFFTARGSEFEPAAPGGAAASVNALGDASVDTRGVEVVGIHKTESSRPALTEADVVVSGGRGMREGGQLQGARGAHRPARRCAREPAAPRPTRAWSPPTYRSDRPARSSRPTSTSPSRSRARSSTSPA
jgi:electron transfer flavoprotein alpha subunit